MKSIISRNVDAIIGFKLDDLSLINLCNCNIYFNDSFWMNRIIRTYGIVTAQMKNKERTYKKYYLALKYYEKKYTDTRALKEVSKKGYLDLIRFFSYKIRAYTFDKGELEDKLAVIPYTLSRWGHKDLLNYYFMREDNDKDFLEATLGAARGGHLEVEDFFKIEPYGSEAIHYLLKSGNKNFTDFLRKNWETTGLISSHFYAAGVSGNIEWVKLCMEKFITENWYWGLEGAAKEGHMELIDFFMEMGAKPYYGLLGASKRGDMKLVQYFIDKGANPKNGNVLTAAARKGHLDLVKFFIEKGADSYVEAFQSAESGGYREVMEYLQCTFL